jgi:YD repeat-containing protein
MGQGTSGLMCYVCKGLFPSIPHSLKVVEYNKDGDPVKVVHRNGKCRLVYDGRLSSYSDTSWGPGDE